MMIRLLCQGATKRGKTAPGASRVNEASGAEPNDQIPMTMIRRLCRIDRGELPVCQRFPKRLPE
jgi:hypothetical protein